MALYYRKDLFDKAGLSVPKTWDEYAEDAVKIKALGGNITNFAKATSTSSPGSCRRPVASGSRTPARTGRST